MAAFNVDAFRSLDEFKKEVAEFAAYLKSCPPATGFTEVFYPGELEHLRTQQKITRRYFIEDATWDTLKSLAEEYGIAASLGF